MIEHLENRYLLTGSLVNGTLTVNTGFSPEVFTIGEDAASIPVSATAVRILSTLSWVTWSDGRLTRYSTPPSNMSALRIILSKNLDLACGRR